MSETIMLPCGHFAKVSHIAGTRVIQCDNVEQGIYTCDTAVDVKAISVVNYVISEHAPSLF